MELLVMPVSKSPVGIFLAELEARWLPIRVANFREKKYSAEQRNRKGSEFHFEPFRGRDKLSEFRSEPFTEEKNVRNSNSVLNTTQKIKISEFGFEPFHRREKMVEEAV
jgi:hypothetical protein